MLIEVRSGYILDIFGRWIHPGLLMDCGCGEEIIRGHWKRD